MHVNVRHREVPVADFVPDVVDLHVLWLRVAARHLAHHLHIQSGARVLVLVLELALQVHATVVDPVQLLPAAPLVALKVLHAVGLRALLAEPHQLPVDLDLRLHAVIRAYLVALVVDLVLEKVLGAARHLTRRCCHLPCCDCCQSALRLPFVVEVQACLAAPPVLLEQVHRLQARALLAEAHPPARDLHSERLAVLVADPVALVVPALLREVRGAPPDLAPGGRHADCRSGPVACLGLRPAALGVLLGAWGR
mmetsp:Transcript_20170/g.48030  ORF Transcript_20170/g.48030 Transcript_20170/m.48030 type:complete len:252 (-) Transcript_20170:1357-2112(-)